MPSNQAKVTSVEVIDAFRASLIIFQSKARRCLDDAADELRRMRMWLQHDQRLRWRERGVGNAESRISNARRGNLR